MSSTCFGVTSRMRVFASAMSCGYVFIVRALSFDDYRAPVGVEHGGCAERQCELVVDVAERRVGDAWHAAAIGDFLQYALERKRLFRHARVRRNFREAPEDEPRALGQRARERQLHEHAIDTVDSFVD